ncbi:hypothetical protein, partial [Paraburkholderia steynii]|uniref:hypothetical protein n=1 Tax=Paraburkholderia steynii TaxID=1245441 RepID=UPI001ABEAD9A
MLMLTDCWEVCREVVVFVFVFVCDAGLGLCRCAGGLVFWGLRWHSRYAFVLHASPSSFCLFAGIRDSLACFRRRPCAGRHLLFFAAAKKSRQKKAAHTA